MADKRLKRMLADGIADDVLGSYGFAKADLIEGVALCAAAVLLDANGNLRTVDKEGAVSTVSPTFDSATITTLSVGSGSFTTNYTAYLYGGAQVSGYLNCYDCVPSNSLTLPGSVPAGNLGTYASASSGELYVDGSAFVKRKA